MNSSARRQGRFLRSATTAQEDVVVISEPVRATLPVGGALATVAEVLKAAQERAMTIIAEAEQQAAALLAQANTNVSASRQAAYQDGFNAGYEEGLARAEAEVASRLDLVRSATADGMAIRDQVAAQALPILAESVALATRRIVGEWYDANPASTVEICREALRAASGQEIISLRINPGVSDHVTASLGSAGKYVLPDDSVAIGGCILDLQSGTLDATLDTRISLLEAGLAHAAGGGDE